MYSSAKPFTFISSKVSISTIQLITSSFNLNKRVLLLRC
jgi:hypothetical protein